MKIRVIKNTKDYEEALEYLDVLMSSDPTPASEDGQKLDLLVKLIEDYEDVQFPEVHTSPTDAIKFRMEQLSLKPADLVPYLGTRSRVTEVLSEKRPLSIEMIRNLETGLGIPSSILIQKQLSNENIVEGDTSLQEKLGDYFNRFNAALKVSSNLAPALLRQSSYRLSPDTDKQSLSLWLFCVIEKAKEVPAPKIYVEGSVDLIFMQSLAKLSINDDGPLLAQKRLYDFGVILVIMPKLPKTRLDGALTFYNRTPVIGMTLRHDRIDNFWFTLMHELAHLSLHTQEGIEAIYDELDDYKGEKINRVEREADALASEALVPASLWDLSPARLIPSMMAATSLAQQLKIHVAIVVGKIRYSGGRWSQLSDHIAQAKVRHMFPDEHWSD